MIDPEDLVLVQGTPDMGVELPGGLQAVAEWLLNHDAAPEAILAVCVLFLICKLCFAELLDHGAEQPIGNGEIKDGVAACAVGLFGVIEDHAELVIQLRLG